MLYYLPTSHRRPPLRRFPLCPAWLAVLGLALLGRTAQAQTFTWKNLVTLYGDNTEFFTPYRIGETILGGQFQSYLSVETGRRTEVVAGLFGDHRSGDESFLDPVKPILGFRYRTTRGLGAIGTLVTEDRHGLIEPLEVTTLELTRPIEYGLQWRERRRLLDYELFLNWQHLNTPASREIFDYGLVLSGRPTSFLTLAFQAHGLHHGGQLATAGVGVTNNRASGPGLELHGDLPVLGRASLGAFRLSSTGNIDPNAPAGRPRSGHGTYLRGALRPGGWFDFFVIQWWGRNFLSDEGDHNYNSVGHDPSFYRASRRYQEYGVRRLFPIEAGVTFDAEWRFHRIDNERSIALGHSKWEYSYRVVIRAPFELRLGTR